MGVSNNSPKIFLDSNFLVGLYATSDSLHQKCLSLSTRLASQPGTKLYISNYVLTEVLTVLSQRAGKKTAITAGEKIIESKYFTIVQHNTESDILAWRLFKQVENKNTSFIDVAIIRRMKLEGISNLTTFDIQLAKLAKAHKIKVLQS